MMKSAHKGSKKQALAVAIPVLALFIFFTLSLNPIFAQHQETQQKEWEDFNPDLFSHSTNIDNQWFPLKPGTRLTWEGTTIDEEGEAIPHRVVFVVTDLTKVIGGVRSVVCWDQDYSDGSLEETELVFFAQDNDGNVWHLGQYPEVYEDSKLVEAPAWLHGYEDAVAGIMMKAAPKMDAPSYSQGWGPAVGWTDRGMAHQMGQSVAVPAGSYDDVLVIKEWAKEEPDAFQLKYYAKGVGNISVGWLGEGEKTRETLDLVKVEHLDAKAMAEVRKGALQLEKNAYKNSTTVYAHTQPAEPMAASHEKH
ncbi:MAG: hypothetical protein H6695_13690 [Deferribacteres bacterium]|nr:hypothetical protein [candidate division KSB1 bacterium]MCB9511238.1 hypothetical protein [Deferribacteres bacterium]